MDDFYAFLGGVVVTIIIALIATTPNVTARDTECDLRFQLATTPSDTVAVVAEFSYCAARLSSDSEGDDS